MLEKLKVNEKVDIIVKTGPYQGKYLSKIAEMDSDKIKVTSPFIKGEVVPLRLEQIVNLYFTSDIAAYTFPARIIERQSEPLALITIEKIGELKRIQRREFFRLDAKKKVKYRLIEDPLDPEEDEPIELKETETIDISGGGIKMNVDNDFPREGFVELYLDLPEIDSIPIFGKIVNEYSLADGRAVGIKFLDIARAVQEKIISWLFDYQRQLRKKGLL
ncbi:MAG: flagellar brake protein [bacterium]